MTKLDHDGNIAPWLELAHDKGLDRALRATSTTSAGSTSTSCARCVSERTRVVAFPWASNARRHGHAGRGDRRARARGRRARLGRRRALRAARADRRRRGRRRRAALLAVQVLRAAPRARRSAAASCSRRWRPYKVRPAPTVPGRPPLRDRHARARAARRLHRGGRVPRRRRLGVHRRARARRSGSGSSTACRTAGRCTGPPTMEGRVPTFAITHADGVARPTRRRASASAASRSGTATTTRSRS